MAAPAESISGQKKESVLGMTRAAARVERSENVKEMQNIT